MKEWFKAAGIRALRTFAQAACSLIGGDMVGILDIDWIGVLSIAATAAVLSLLTSVAGLPELEGKSNGE